MFGTCDCCGYDDTTAVVRFGTPAYGFLPFWPQFDATYTVGTGWSATSMTIGKIAKRVSSGVVTGVYEAKGTFTASADPSTDTTNWRHAGLTATAGETNYWHNCDPILKWTVKALFTVGTGWGTASGIGFGGNRPDESLSFAIGDLVTRTNAGTLSHYRCKTAVDRTGDPTAGDPATDTGNWEVYNGARSLWLDFTVPASAGYAAPFAVHYTPKTRYQTWTEVTEVLLDDVSQATYTRQFTRDPLSGILTTVDDDTPGVSDTLTVNYPDMPVPENPARPDPPALPVDSPAEPEYRALGDPWEEEYNFWGIVDASYNPIESLELPKATYPRTPQATTSGAYSYKWVDDITLETDYYIGTGFYEPAGGISANYSANLALSDLTLSSAETEFTYGMTLPWYWAVVVQMQYYAYWSGSAWSYRGLTTMVSQTQMTFDIGVTQTVTLSSTQDMSAVVDDCIALLPAYPSYGYLTDCRLDNTGALESDAPASANYLEAYRNLYNNGSRAFNIRTDFRYNENQVNLLKLSADMVTPDHWTLELTHGGSPTETAYTAAATHSFAPVDDTLKAVKVTVTDPSP